MSPGWLVDARHAARLVRRQPRFAAAAILLPATGIGAAAAVFTLVNAVVLVDMPFRDPDRLAWMYNARTERDRAPLSIPDLQDRTAHRPQQQFPIDDARKVGISLTRLMVRGELLPLVGGLAAGLAIAFVAARALGDLLFATSPGDPAVYALLAGGVLCVTAVAIWLPARRAARANPADLLRS
jgi:hypothetical protein